MLQIFQFTAFSLTKSIAFQRHTQTKTGGDFPSVVPTASTKSPVGRSGFSTWSTSPSGPCPAWLKFLALKFFVGCLFQILCPLKSVFSLTLNSMRDGHQLPRTVHQLSPEITL